MKECRICHIKKKESEFQKDKTRKDGLVNKCKKCSSEYNKNYFLKHPDKYQNKKKIHKKWRDKNPKKILAAQKRFFNKNPQYKEIMKFNSWKCALKNRFNLTVEQFDNMKLQQNNKCCICKRDFNSGICNTWNKKLKRPFVDHDHKTGKVRGLLCHYCNAGLGNFSDNIDYLNNAITYLNKGKN
jgi:hypothetical protein